MIISRIVFIKMYLLGVCCMAIAQPINEELVRYIDLTGDGRPEKITLNLKATDISKPVSWSLIIWSDKKVLLKHTSDDSRIDTFFNDPKYVTNCTGYIDCKEKWYFKDILDIIIVPPTGYDLEGILDKKYDNTLYPLGRAYLSKCCGIGPKKADQILSRIEKRIRSGSAVMITIPDTPATAGALMTYCPEVNRFIPVYED
jgi:hypothetical protein